MHFFSLLIKACFIWANHNASMDRSYWMFGVPTLNPSVLLASGSCTNDNDRLVWKNKYIYIAPVHGKPKVFMMPTLSSLVAMEMTKLAPWQLNFKWVSAMHYPTDKFSVADKFSNISQILHFYHIEMENSELAMTELGLIIPSEQRSCWGVYWFHSVRLSVRPSVRLSRLPWPLCNIYSSEWILSILATNDHYHERVCRTQWPLTLTYIFKVIQPWLRKSCPLCSVYSSGWILFIFGTNEHYH